MDERCSREREEGEQRTTMEDERETVSNKQVVLKKYVIGFPKESDMEVKQVKIRLKLPQDSNGLLVKNLYLSCDPYMRGRMSRPDQLRPYFVENFKPGSVRKNETHFLCIRHFLF
ncbi:hypothetical protein Dimus_021909 [Dionaea muscipula]